MASATRATSLSFVTAALRWCLPGAIANGVRALQSLAVLGAAAMAAGMGADASAWGDDAVAADAVDLYRSPTAIVAAHEGRLLLVTDVTRRNVTLLDTQQSTPLCEIPLQGTPGALVLSPDESHLYVTERETGTVALLQVDSATVRHRIHVGGWPVALALAPQANRLYVARQDNHTIVVVDLAAVETASGSVDVGDVAEPQAPLLTSLPAVREPSDLALTPDGSRLLVANLLPRGSGLDPNLAAHVLIIDTQTLKVAHAIPLPPGSTLARGLCVSPDGQWCYVVHSLGRFQMPITQLERGWVNTAALSIIHVASGTRWATVLLDNLTAGAPDPYDVVCTGDGQRLFISHAGVHEISLLDIGQVHHLLNGQIPPRLAKLQDGTLPNIWVRIQRDATAREQLSNELAALWTADVIRRVPSMGLKPQGMTLDEQHERLWVTHCYSGRVDGLSLPDGSAVATISLGSQPPTDAVRRGELVFHDARHAFQRWYSCATCHPNQGRTDGLRWDFVRDGIGNGKDTPSLLALEHTAPFNRRATRGTVRQCARTGLSDGHMLAPRDETVDDLLAYLLTLRPEPSPHRTSTGHLTESAARGEQLFHGKADCARCHPPPYYTDNKMHNVGVISSQEPDGQYDTPSLLELHRSAPYLHDGRAESLEAVLTNHNERQQHGDAHRLTAAERRDLIQFLRSI